MTCFVDLIVDFLAVEDDDDAAACVMARLSIRVVNMAKMFSRIDTSSSSENGVVVVKIPLYFAIKSDDAQGLIRLNTHESNAHNLARDDDDCVFLRGTDSSTFFVVVVVE